MKRANAISLRTITLAAALFVAGPPALAQHPPVLVRLHSGDRAEPHYDAAIHYRTGEQYPVRLLGGDERVYRGGDGHYYCRRGDSTTGRIIGAVDEDALGNAIDKGHSATTDTLIAGYVATIQGQAYDRHNHEIRCR